MVALAGSKVLPMVAPCRPELVLLAVVVAVHLLNITLAQVEARVVIQLLAVEPAAAVVPPAAPLLLEEVAVVVQMAAVATILAAQVVAASVSTVREPMV
jgi:hypothetical protein